jgi:anti-sigma regulatory factor (Ser/Thr protein kinase)
MLRAPGACHARAVTQNVAISAREQTVTWEYRLSARPESVANARRHVRYALAAQTETSALHDIELVVSELVTNAVRHGPSGLITLRLVTDAEGNVAGEVVDQGDGVVAIRERAPDTAGGLGLPIVDSLTSSWGVRPGSTHVWFRFDS